MNRLLLACLVLCGFSSKAQYQKSVAETKVDSLVRIIRAQRIDTILIVELYCVGCRMDSNSPCAAKGLSVSTYILWLHMRRTNVSYVDNCLVKKPVAIGNNEVWSYLFLNKLAFSSKEIKPLTVLEDGKPERLRRNHGFKYSYQFLIGRDTISQYYAAFDLLKRTEFMHKQVKNIYYKENVNNPAWKIVSLFRRAIADAEKQWYSQR